jgi:hypothetical protein
MSIYLDSLTLIIALVVLVLYSKWLFEDFKLLNFTAFVAIVSYLFAQTGWTVAFFQGDVWGRDFNNYIWFIFNTSIFFTLIQLWVRRGSLTEKESDDEWTD